MGHYASEMRDPEPRSWLVIKRPDLEARGLAALEEKFGRGSAGAAFYINSIIENSLKSSIENLEKTFGKNAMAVAFYIDSIGKSSWGLNAKNFEDSYKCARDAALKEGLITDTKPKRAKGPSPR